MQFFSSRSRAVLASAVVVSVSLAGLTVAAAPAQAEPAEVIRVSGPTRYATAAAAAALAHPDGASRVVLASGEDFPDALAAGALAGSLDAPILLTPQDRLDDATLAGLRDLGAEQVTVMGGESAVDGAVVDALEAEGFEVARIAGGDRFETAAMAAGEVGGTTVVLANGSGFADALSISPAAQALELPILLTDAPELAAPSAAYIDAADVDEVIVVGGTGVVSQSIEDGLEADGIAVTRLAGTDRYESAVEIAKFHLDNGFEADELVMATGESFADALAGGPLASQLAAPLVLTERDELNSTTRALIESIAPSLETLYVLGGSAAVGDAVAAAAAAAADGPVEVRPDDGLTTVTAGRSFTGALVAEGRDITSVAVSGPCTTSDDDLDDVGAAGGEEFGFSVPILAGAPAGSCTITFTVTLADREQPVVVSQAVTVEPPATSQGGGGTPPPPVFDTFHVDDDADPSGDGSPEAPFATIQEAVDAASDGDQVIVADGDYEEDVTIHGKDLQVRAMVDDNDTMPLVQGTFEITDVAAGELRGFEVADIAPDLEERRAGIRLDTVSHYVIVGNVLGGTELDDGPVLVASETGVGIVNDVDGGTEQVTIADNLFRTLEHGVESHPSADLEITGNRFLGNENGISSAAGDEIAGNAFDGSWGYAVALEAPGATVSGNVFGAQNWVNVADFTGDHDLGAIRAANEFEQAQDIDETGTPRVIRDAGEIETEPNDTVETADVFAPSGSAILAAGSGADVDHFQFSLDEAAVVRIETFGDCVADSGDGDTVVGLYQADGTTLIEEDDDDGAQRYCSWISRILDPGTYVVRVQAYGEEQPEYRYVLEVAFDDIPER